MFFINRNSDLEKISVMELYKLHINDDIDESPYYQRFGGIWSIEKKRLLIDSIINGYDVPKFYLHYMLLKNNSLNPSNKKYAVIDGKQRIGALIEFLGDKFELDDSVKCLDEPNLELKGKKYSDLAKSNALWAIKERIDRYQLDVIHITTDDLDMIEEMFLRLNEGVPVNNAEKRNSIGGYLIDGVNSLVKNSDFFKNKVRFGNKRMEHQDLAVKLCLIEHNQGVVAGFTKMTLDNLVKEFKPKKGSTEVAKERQKTEATQLVNKVSKRLKVMADIFVDNDEILKSKGIIPLYYIFLEKEGSGSLQSVRNFLSEFQAARTLNRKSNKTGKTNSTLLRFDQLNQQGANQGKSLETRLKIMYFYYKESVWDFRKEMSLSEIGLENLDSE